MCVGGGGVFFLLFLFSPPLGICAKAITWFVQLVTGDLRNKHTCVRAWPVRIYIYISGQRGVVRRPKRMYIHHVSVLCMHVLAVIHFRSVSHCHVTQFMTLVHDQSLYYLMMIWGLMSSDVGRLTY